MRQNTEPEAPPEKRAGSFRFPVALFERLEAHAGAERRSVNFVLERAAERYLDELEAEAGAVGQAETAPRGEL